MKSLTKIVAISLLVMPFAAFAAPAHRDVASIYIGPANNAIDDGSSIYIGPADSAI